ncbi:hypothetical protein LIZ84_17500, partial [Roseburia faecis]|nr:hypothetical protein [Roseburia faecis]
MFTIPYVYDRCKKKHPGLEKPKAMQWKNPILHGFTNLILHHRDYITCLLHFFCKIIDRHSCFLCTC